MAEASLNETEDRRELDLQFLQLVRGWQIKYSIYYADRTKVHDD